jgi:pyridoxamine 5'-phosphate oxidase
VSDRGKEPLRQLAALREEYARVGLHEADLPTDPVILFEQWLADAVASGMHEPTAMAVSTLGPDGAPNSRLVLLKSVDERGLAFFTNYRSRKARDLATDPRCAAVFPWHCILRQVRVEGRAERVSSEESDAYFATRPRGSQLGAWASPQSEEVPDREYLDRAYEKTELRWPETASIPRPEHWGGIRIVPAAVEFWQGRSARMHDRIYYSRVGQSWKFGRLAP